MLCFVFPDCFVNIKSYRDGLFVKTIFFEDIESRRDLISVENGFPIIDFVP